MGPIRKRSLVFARWSAWIGFCVLVAAACSVAPPTDLSANGVASPAKGDALGEGVALALARQEGGQWSLCGSNAAAGSIAVGEAALEACLRDGGPPRCWQLLVDPEVGLEWNVAVGWPTAEEKRPQYREAMAALQSVFSVGDDLPDAQERQLLETLQHDFYYTNGEFLTIAVLQIAMRFAFGKLAELSAGLPPPLALVVAGAINGLSYLVGRIVDSVIEKRAANRVLNLPDAVRFTQGLASARRLLAQLQSGDDPFGDESPREVVLREVLPELAGDPDTPLPAPLFDSSWSHDFLAAAGQTPADAEHGIFAAPLTVIMEDPEHATGFDIAPRQVSRTASRDATGRENRYPGLMTYVNLTPDDFIVSVPGLVSPDELAWPGSDAVKNPCRAALRTHQACVPAYGTWVGYVPKRVNNRRTRSVHFFRVGDEHRERFQDLDWPWQELEHGSPGPTRPDPSQPLTCAMADPPDGSGISEVEVAREALERALEEIWVRADGKEDQMPDCEGIVDSLLTRADILPDFLRDQLEQLKQEIAANTVGGPRPTSLVQPLEGPLERFSPLPRVLPETDRRLGDYINDYKAAFQVKNGKPPTESEGLNKYWRGLVLVCKIAKDKVVIASPDEYTGSEGWPILAHVWNLGEHTLQLYVPKVDHVRGRIWPAREGTIRGREERVVAIESDLLARPRPFEIKDGAPNAFWRAEVEFAP